MAKDLDKYFYSSEPGTSYSLAVNPDSNAKMPTCTTTSPQQPTSYQEMNTYGLPAATSSHNSYPISYQDINYEPQKTSYYYAGADSQSWWTPTRQLPLPKDDSGNCDQTWSINKKNTTDSTPIAIDSGSGYFYPDFMNNYYHNNINYSLSTTQNQSKGHYDTIVSNANKYQPTTLNSFVKNTFTYSVPQGNQAVERPTVISYPSQQNTSGNYNSEIRLTTIATKRVEAALMEPALSLTVTPPITKTSPAKRLKLRQPKKLTPDGRKTVPPQTREHTKAFNEALKNEFSGTIREQRGFHRALNKIIAQAKSIGWKEALNNDTWRTLTTFTCRIEKFYESEGGYFCDDCITLTHPEFHKYERHDNHLLQSKTVLISEICQRCYCTLRKIRRATICPFCITSYWTLKDALRQETEPLTKYPILRAALKN